MKSVVTSLLLVLALVVSQILAIPQNRGGAGGGPGHGGPGDGGGGRPTCGTVYGPRQTLVGRKMTTSTKLVKSTTTIFRTSLFTRTPGTSTVSVTSTVTLLSTTTLSTPTNTVRTTVTESTTTVLTQSFSQTSTSVITVPLSTVSTSTIPALPGFTPIESSLTEVIDPPPGRKRQNRQQQGQNTGKIGGNKCEHDDRSHSDRVQHDRDHRFPGYPQQVKCTVVVTKTSTIRKTSTLLSTVMAPTPVLTITGTTTSVSVSTIDAAPASLTITDSTTATLSNTISTTLILTELSTSTSTVYTSTTTEYAACQTNNVINSFNDGGLGSYSYSAQNYGVNALVYEDVLTPLDCCILAVENPNTWFYSFLSPAADAFICQIITGETCPVPTTPVVIAPETTQTAQATLGYAATVPTSAGFVVGNGACGVVAFATDVSVPP